MPFLRIFLIAILSLVGFQSSGARAAERLVVFAAASMKEAVVEIAKNYENICKCSVVLSVGGTGMLARQVAEGAPADIFISADQKWMEYLSKKEAIDQESIRPIASNQLVIAVAKSQAESENPLQLLDHDRFAMADPGSVPAGRYAKQALENLGEWEAFRHNAVQTENVRIALTMAARGDVTSAIVYASDLLVEPRVKAAFQFAPELHSEILYLAAITKSADTGARAFIEYLQSQPAQTILQNFGFSAVTGK